MHLNVVLVKLVSFGSERRDQLPKTAQALRAIIAVREPTSFHEAALHFHVVSITGAAPKRISMAESTSSRGVPHMLHGWWNISYRQVGFEFHNTDTATPSELLFRTAFYGWKMSDLKKTLSHGGIIGIVLWMIGLVASSACIRFDEALAPSAVSCEKPLRITWRSSSSSILGRGHPHAWAANILESMQRCESRVCKFGLASVGTQARLQCARWHHQEVSPFCTTKFLRATSR